LNVAHMEVTCNINALDTRLSWAIVTKICPNLIYRRK
jgi:hypothetical protein